MTNFSFDRTGQKYPVEVLDGEEVRAIMAATSRRGECGVRDRALIAVLYRSGIRIGESLALRPKDVSIENGTVNVLHGKNDKQRMVAVDGETVALIGHWLDVRRRREIGENEPLFCTLEGAEMSQVQVRQHLKILAKKAGVAKRVHPHALRHTIAAELVREGVDLSTIQGVLGHSNAATTDRYLRQIQPARVIATLRQRKW